MKCCVAPWCTAMYYDVSCTTIFYDVLWCAMMDYDVWCCIMMYYDVRWCTVLYYDVLCCMMMYCDVLWCPPQGPQGPFKSLTALCLELDFVGAGSSKVHLRDHSNVSMLMFRVGLRASGLEWSPPQGPLNISTVLCWELDFVWAGSSKVHLRDHSNH